MVPTWTLGPVTMWEAQEPKLPAMLPPRASICKVAPPGLTLPWLVGPRKQVNGELAFNTMSELTEGSHHLC